MIGYGELVFCPFFYKFYKSSISTGCVLVFGVRDIHILEVQVQVRVRAAPLRPVGVVHL